MPILHSLIIQAATTSTTTGKSKSSGGQYTFLILIAILAVAYLFFIRPRQQRARQQQRAAKELGIGDAVMSAGGIYGTVVGLGTDDVDVEVSPGIILTFTRRAISIRPGAPANPAAVDDDSIHDPDDDADSEHDDYESEDYDDSEESDDEAPDYSDADEEEADEPEPGDASPEEEHGDAEPEEDATTGAGGDPSLEPPESDSTESDGTADRRNGRRGKRR